MAKKLELRRRDLQLLIVRKVHITDFLPSKHTLEKSDVPQIVQEFDRFLSSQFAVGGEDELPVVEIE